GPDAIGVCHDVEGETLRWQPRKDGAVGQVHGAGAPQAAVAVTGERAVLDRDRERPGVVDAGAVSGADALERHAAEPAEAAQHHPLVRPLHALLLLAGLVADGEGVRTVARAPPERARLGSARPVLVMDPENREARHEDLEHAARLARRERQLLHE